MTRDPLTHCRLWCRRGFWAAVRGRGTCVPGGPVRQRSSGRRSDVARRPASLPRRRGRPAAGRRRRPAPQPGRLPQQLAAGADAVVDRRRQRAVELGRR